MSLSDKSGAIQEFRLPPLAPESGGSHWGGASFVLQIFDTNSAAEASSQTGESTALADQILAAPEEQRQFIEQQAYEEGFRQGQKDGQEVGRRGLEEVIQRFEKMLAALAEEKEALCRRRERDLVELALVVSRKIIGRELTVQPEAIRDVVEAAFRSLHDAEVLKLRIHPQDYELLAQHSRDSWPAGVHLVPDGTLTPGGFKLETERGEIDGTLETRWAQVKAAIDQALECRHED